MQLNLELASPLPTDPAALAKEVLKKISTAEKDYQTRLNEAYAELSDKTFKELRRALPVHKQKLDWNRITSYKLNSELKRGD